MSIIWNSGRGISSSSLQDHTQGIKNKNSFTRSFDFQPQNVITAENASRFHLLGRFLSFSSQSEHKCRVTVKGMKTMGPVVPFTKHNALFGGHYEL